MTGGARRFIRCSIFPPTHQMLCTMSNLDVFNSLIHILKGFVWNMPKLLMGHTLSTKFATKYESLKHWKPNRIVFGIKRALHKIIPFLIPTCLCKSTDLNEKSGADEHQFRLELNSIFMGSQRYRS